MSKTIDKVEELKESKRAIYLGSAEGNQLYASFEDTVSVLAGTRSRKSTGIIIPSVAVHPGPVIVTSTRNDIRNATLRCRQEIAKHYGGAVQELVFDGDRDGPYVTPLAFWDPVTSASTWQTARRIAGEIVYTAIPPKGDQRHWAARSKSLLASLLYISNFRGYSLYDLKTQYHLDQCRSFWHDALEISQWTKDHYSHARDTGSEIEPPVTDSGLQGCTEAFESLNGLFGDGYVADEELRSIHSTFTSILDEIDAQPRADFETFDFQSFVESHGCLYIRCDPARQEALAPLISGFVSQLTRSWISATSHLHDQPLDRECTLLLALDETHNVARLPKLPSMIHTSGGDGIQIITTLQSAESAREIWGAAGTALISGTNHKVFTKEFEGNDDLESLSLNLGTHDEDIVVPRIGKRYRYEYGYATETRLLNERVRIEAALNAPHANREYLENLTKLLREIQDERTADKVMNRNDPTTPSELPFQYLLDEILELTEIAKMPVERRNVPRSKLFLSPSDKALVVSHGKPYEVDLVGYFQDPVWKDIIHPVSTRLDIGRAL